MKNKTLVMVSAAIITTAAMVLTFALSLLHSSADETEPTPIESALPITEPVNSQIKIDDVEEPQKIEENQEFNVGQNVIDPNHFAAPIEEVLYFKDIIIDIYEHSTGKLVGRVTVLDDEVYEFSEKLFDETFDWTRQCFDVDDTDATPVTLPEGKYRIEVYSVKAVVSYGHLNGIQGCFAMSHTYGSEDAIWEFTQTGLTFYGCEEYIAFIDGIISEEIANIEAGNGNIPDESMSKMTRFEDEDGYWEKVERYTERFPYLQD